MRRGLLLVPLGLLVLCTNLNCASLVSGADQKVTFHSDPPGARVVMNGAYLGETPVTVSLSRWKGGPVRYDLAGYEVSHLHMDRELNLVTLLNTPFLLLGILPGLVGFGVDVATGAMFEFDPRAYHVILTPVAPSPVQPPEQ